MAEHNCPANVDCLDQANIVLERFRFQMRLAKDLKVLAPNSFEFQAKAVEEIGRMIGGSVVACPEWHIVKGLYNRPVFCNRSRPGEIAVWLSKRPGSLL